MLSKLYVIIFLLSVSCFSQMNNTNLWMMRGDPTAFSFTYNKNLTGDSLIFVVKASKTITAVRLIEKTTYDNEITVTAGATSFFYVALLSGDTDDLTLAKYYYDIQRIHDEDTTTIFIGELNLQPDIGTPFDGTDVTGRVTTVSLNNGTTNRELIWWDSVNEYWEPSGIVFSAGGSVGNADSLGGLPASSYLLKSAFVDSNVLHKKYSGSAFSSIDTVVFGGYSLTQFYNRGVVGGVDLPLQGRFQIRKGLNILPDATYGYSNVNFYQGGNDIRGMSLLNFNRWNGTKQKYEPIYQMGVDVGAPLTTDSIPPLFVLLAARDTANVANDLFGIVGHDHVFSLANRYRGTFLVNSMGLGGAVFNISSIGTRHPSSYYILRLHRANDDSTNGWMWFSHGNSGLPSFIWQDSVAGGITNALTWYDRSTGSFSYLAGYGYKFQFTNNNNDLEIQGGSLTYKGGIFTLNPNRTDWDSPSLYVISNNVATTPFDNGFGLKLRNINNTTNAYTQIYNQNYASVTNSSINFVNVDQTSKGAITFNTKDTDTQGERVRITEGGHLILKAVETDITSSQMTVNDVAVYLKDNKLKVASLVDGGVRIKALNLTAADDSTILDDGYSSFIVQDTLGTELITNKSFETLLTGSVDDGASDDWLAWGESTSSGLVEAVTGSKFNNGVKITNNTGSTYGNLDVTQNVTVTAETNYRLTFWTKGDGTNSGAYRIYDNTNAADIVASSLGNNSISGTTWTQKSIDFVTPAGCVLALIYLYGHTTNGSIIYYDSASLREIQ